MHKALTIMLIIVACSNLPAAAATLYKWVDSDGVTHYDQTPPNNIRAEVVEINDNRSATREPKSEPESVNLQQDSQPSRLAEGSAQPSPHQLAQQQSEPPELKLLQTKVRQHNCNIARKQLTALENAGRIRQHDSDSGDYRYLPDAEKLAQINQMRDYIRQQCTR